MNTDRSEQTVQTQIRLLQKEQSDQGLHYFLFNLHFSDTLLHCKTKEFLFKTMTVIDLHVPIFLIFMVVHLLKIENELQSHFISMPIGMYRKSYWTTIDITRVAALAKCYKVLC